MFMMNINNMVKQFGLGVLLVFCAALADVGAVEIDGVGGTSYSVKTTSLKEMRLRAAFRTTVRQMEDFSCGSAAIATLLTYHYQRPLSEREVLEAMFVKGDQAKIRREGFSLLDMKNYLESHGYRADGFQVTLDKLVSTSTPAIALIRDNGYNHFVVVKGTRDDKVLIGDPAIGARVMARADFEKIWANQIFFVIHSHRDLAQFNVGDHWRVHPAALLDQAISRDSLAAITLLRPDPSTDF